MSQFTRAEHAIDYYEHPTFYCREPGCDWTQEAEWNRESMSNAEKAGIDHWNSVHKAPTPSPAPTDSPPRGNFLPGNAIPDPNGACIPLVIPWPDPNAYKAARGIAPAPPGSLSPEEVIRKIRGESS